MGMSTEALEIADYVEATAIARRLAGSDDPIKFSMAHKDGRTIEVLVPVSKAVKWVAELRALNAN